MLLTACLPELARPNNQSVMLKRYRYPFSGNATKSAIIHSLFDSPAATAGDGFRLRLPVSYVIIGLVESVGALAPNVVA